MTDQTAIDKELNKVLKQLEKDIKKPYAICIKVSDTVRDVE